MHAKIHEKEHAILNCHYQQNDDKTKTSNLGKML